MKRILKKIIFLISAIVLISIVNINYQVNAVAIQTPTINVTMASYNANKITINKVNGASGYQIYRATSPNGNYQCIKETASLSYTDTKITTGKTYYYRIKAYKKVGNSRVYGNPSKVVSAKPILKVASFTLKANGTTSINITIDSVVGAKQYEIYFSTAESGNYKKIATISNLSYTHNGLVSGNNYYYKIKAIGDSTSSALSTAKSVKTKNAEIQEGVYTITLASTGMALNVNSDSTTPENSTNINIWKKTGHITQSWYIKPIENNMYQLGVCGSTGKTLNIGIGNGTDSKPGTNAFVWDWWKGSGQVFSIKQIGDNYYFETINKDVVLGADNDVNNGANVSLQKYTGASTQIWKLQKESSNFSKPLRGNITITDTFMCNCWAHPNNSNPHYGVDMVSSDYNIYSIGSGVVAYRGYDQWRGNYIVIKHDNGYYSQYQHMNSMNVSKGQRVTKDTKIGVMGNTGNSYGAHLHLEVSKNFNGTVLTNQINPLNVLPKF